MFKKFVSLLTAVAFVYSFIAAPCVQGAIDLAGVARGAAQARAALSLPTLSFGLDISPAIGRITDARDFGNGPLVINIQDLHCAPEVQRNIAAILGQVATSFGSPTAGTEPDQSARRIQVFVEGGYGAVDTSWITAIKDPAIRTRVVNALVNDGRLTGSELYAMNSARPPMLAGLENEKLHKENIVRLGKIIENKPRFEKTLKSLRAELGVMQARHFTTQNKRLSRIIESYRAGKLSTGEYHTLLAKYIERISRTPRAYNNVFSLNIDQYPDIKTHLALSALTEHMDYGRVATQMQRFMQGLKGVMPFREYSALLAKSKNFSDMDRLYAVLSTMMSGPADAGPWVSAAQRELARYGELKKFFAYIALKEKINPVGLVREDARLVEDLRAALSRSVSEQEVAFLVDFFDCFDAYLLNRLTAADYEYFKSRFEKFRGVWGKYVFENRVNALADVFPLLDEYYAVNAQRNDVFMQALHLPTMGSNRDVSVVVSGGFHTDGLTALLAQKKISYVTITPNVTQDTRSAGVTYQRLAREQAQVFGSQALQLALGSSYGAKVISANPSEAVIEINGKTIILRGQGAVFTAIEDSNQALADKKISADDFLATVNAAGKLATDQIRALPNSDLAAKIILDLARAVIDSGSSLGWWGEEGLVWKIASDPDVQRLIASSGTDLNDIARLPAFLQGGIADGARDHAALVDRAQGDVFITALLGMPILQNGVEILFGEGLLPATRAASREQRAVAVYNEKLDGNMATIQDETDRFLAQGDDAIAAKLAASGSLQKPQESVFVAVPLEHSKELRAVVLAVQAILRQVLGDTGVPDAMGVTDKVGYMPVGQLHTTQVGSVPLDKVSARQQSAFANIEDAIRNLGLDPWEYEIIGAQLMPNMAVVIKLRVRSGQVKKIRETAGAAIRADGMDAEWRTGDINHVSIAYLKPATPAKLREFNARLKEFNARYLQKPQQERAIRADRIAFFLVINKIIQSAKSRFIDLSRHADNEPVSGDTWITSALLPQLRTYFPRGVKFILSDLNETLNGADRAPITDQKMDELLGILDGMGNGRFGINSGNSMALLNGRFIEPMKRHIPPERWDHYFHNIPIVCANGTQVWRWDHNKQDYVCVFCDDIDSFAGAGTADNIKEAIRAVAAEHAPLVRTALQATVPVLRADLQAVISGEGTLSYADLEKDMQGIVTDNDLVDINAQPEQAAIAVNQLMDIMLAKLSADPMINDSSSENPRGEIGQIYFSPLGRYGRAAWGTMASDGIDRRVYAEALKEKLKNIPHAGKLSIEVNGKLSVYVGLAGRTGKTFGTKQLKRLMGPFRFLPILFIGNSFTRADSKDSLAIAEVALSVNVGPPSDFPRVLDVPLAGPAGSTLLLKGIAQYNQSYNNQLDNESSLAHERAHVEKALSALAIDSLDLSFADKELASITAALRAGEYSKEIDSTMRAEILVALGMLSLAKDGVVRWSFVHSQVTYYLGELLSHMDGTMDKRGVQRVTMPDGKKYVLPVIIAARNEKGTIERTLEAMLQEAARFEQKHPDILVKFIVGDNNSNDGTFEAVQRFIAERGNHILPRQKMSLDMEYFDTRHKVSIGDHLDILKESKPGKKFALESLMRHVEFMGYPGDRVVFADADIIWEEGVLTSLWAKLDAEPEVKLAGANLQPQKEQLEKAAFWSILEHAIYYGFGGKAHNGRGKFMGFVPGGTWMGANREEVFRDMNITSPLGNDDVGVSILAGAPHIAIVPQAVIRYHVSETWKEFNNVRGRQLRQSEGNLDTVREREYARLIIEKPELDPRKARGLARVWRTYRGRAEANRIANHKVYSVMEMRSLQIAIGFFTSEKLLKMNLQSIKDYIRDIPVLNMPFRYFIVLVTLMLPVYTWLQLKAAYNVTFQKGTVSWNPSRQPVGQPGTAEGPAQEDTTSSLAFTAVLDTQFKRAGSAVPVYRTFKWTIDRPIAENVIFTTALMKLVAGVDAAYGAEGPFTVLLPVFGGTKFNGRFLHWILENGDTYPDQAAMVRNILALQARGYAVLVSRLRRGDMRNYVGEITPVVGFGDISVIVFGGGIFNSPLIRGILTENLRKELDRLPDTAGKKFEFLFVEGSEETSIIGASSLVAVEERRNKIVIGVDVGGTTVKMAGVQYDANGNMVKVFPMQFFSADASQGPDSYYQQINAKVEILKQSLLADGIVSLHIGISHPGKDDGKGRITPGSCPNIGTGKEFDNVDPASKFTGFTATWCNDAIAQGLAGYMRGGRKIVGAQMLYLGPGTGLGVGLFETNSDGEVIRKSDAHFQHDPHFGAYVTDAGISRKIDERLAATLESSRLLEKIVRQIFSIFKGVPPAFLMAAVRPIDECFIAPFVELGRFISLYGVYRKGKASGDMAAYDAAVKQFFAEHGYTEDTHDFGFFQAGMNAIMAASAVSLFLFPFTLLVGHSFYNITANIVNLLQKIGVQVKANSLTAPVMALSDTGGEGFSGHPRPGALLELNALAFGAQQGGDTVIPGTAKHLLEALPALAKKYREVYLVGLLQRGDLATRETLGDRPSGSSNYVGQYPDGKTRLVVHQPWNGVEADRNGGYADPAKARTYATGSTFASANPRAVDPAWGTLADVDVAKEIMKAESGRLIVDVVPNHIGIDNLWVDEFTTILDAQGVPTKVPNWKATVHIDLMSLLTPEELASLSDEDLFSMGTVKKKISPKSYERLSYALYERGMEGDVLRYAVYYATPGDKKSRVLIAHGKDPYQIAWLDSFQLDFTNPIARQYVFDTIKFWADKGISVRTDMSHLLTRGEFKKLWYPHMSWQDFEQAWPREFWNEVVEKIVSTTPDFTLTMEGYQGLDFLKQLDPRVRVYEKGGIFDNVRARNIGWLRNYLQNGIRPNAVHFLQNHDEEGMWDKGNEFMKAATALIMTIPGVPFIHEPQRHGQDRFKIQVLLPNQRPPVPGMEKFMDAMADIAALPLFREGSMQVIETNTNLLVYTREYRGEKAVVVINLTDQPQSGNFVVPNPSPGKDLLLNDEYFPFKHDKNSNAAQSYRRTPQDLERDHGLIVNLAPGDAHIFMMTDVPSVSASAAQLPPNASAVAATLLETYVVVEKLLGWFFKMVYKLDLTGEWWAGENEQKNFPAVRFSREIAAPVLESLYLLDVVSRMYKENWQITYRNAAQKPAEVRKSLVDDLHARNQQTVTMVKGFAQSHDNALPFETVLQRLTLPGLAAYDVAYMSLIGIPFMPVGIAYAWAAMAGYASLFGVHRAFNRSDEGRTMPATIGSAKSAPKSATRRKILKYSLGAGLLSLLPEVTAVPVVASSGGTAHQPVFTAAERGAGATWISGQKTKLGRTDIAQSYEITPEGGIPADVKTFLDGYANTYDLALSGMQLLFNPARTAADITGVQNILNYLTNTLSYNAYMVPYRSNKENTIFTGEVAWAGMLAAQYKALYPDDKASDLLMKRIDTYLLRSDMLFTDNGYQCIKGGPTMSWASTEHNLDTLAYLTMRRKLLQSVAGQEQHCADLRALEVKIALWLRNRAFNGICFNRGANDTMFAADTSSFGVMVLMALQADDPALFEGTGLSQINLETLLHAADIAFDSTTGLYTFGAGAAPTAVASHSGQAAVGSTGNAIRGVGGYDIAGVDRGVTGQAVVVNAPPSTEFSAQMALAKRLLGTADNGDAVLQKVREHLYTSGGVRYVPLGWAGWNDIGNYFAVSYPAMSPTIFAIFLADRGVLVNPFRLVNEATLNPQFKIFLPAIKSGMSWLPIGYGLVRWIARRLAPGVSKNKSTPIVVPPEEVLPPAQDTAQTNTPRGPDEGAFSVAATLESSRLLEKIVRQIFSIFKGVPPAFLMAAVRPIDECFIAPFVELGRFISLYGVYRKGKASGDMAAYDAAVKQFFAEHGYTEDTHDFGFFQAGMNAIMAASAVSLFLFPFTLLVGHSFYNITANIVNLLQKIGVQVKANSLTAPVMVLNDPGSRGWIEHSLTPALKELFPEGVRQVMADLDETLTDGFGTKITDAKIEEIIAAMDAMGETGVVCINSTNPIQELRNRFIDPLFQKLSLEQRQKYCPRMPIVSTNGTQIWQWDAVADAYVCVFCDDIDDVLGEGSVKRIKTLMAEVVHEHSDWIQQDLLALKPALRDEMKAVLAGKDTVLKDIREEVERILRERNIVDIDAQSSQVNGAIEEVYALVKKRVTGGGAIKDLGYQNPHGEINQVIFSPLGEYGKVVRDTFDTDKTRRQKYVTALRHKLLEYSEFSLADAEISGKLSVYVVLGGRTGKAFGTRILKEMGIISRDTPLLFIANSFVSADIKDAEVIPEVTLAINVGAMSPLEGVITTPLPGPAGSTLVLQGLTSYNSNLPADLTASAPGILPETETLINQSVEEQPVPVAETKLNKLGLPMAESDEVLALSPVDYAMGKFIQAVVVMSLTTRVINSAVFQKLQTKIQLKYPSFDIEASMIKVNRVKKIKANKFFLKGTATKMQASVKKGDLIGVLRLFWLCWHPEASYLLGVYGISAMTIRKKMSPEASIAFTFFYSAVAHIVNLPNLLFIVIFGFFVGMSSPWFIIGFAALNFAAIGLFISGILLFGAAIVQRIFKKKSVLAATPLGLDGLIARIEFLPSMLAAFGIGDFIERHGKKNSGARKLVAATRMGLVAGATAGIAGGIAFFGGFLLLPLWGVFGAASACGALAMLILGSGTNLIVHMQIEYVITKNFLMAVKQYGNARLHHGVVDYTVFVVNTPPANINDLNPVSVIKLDGGQQVWGMISPAGQVILYSEASPEQVTRAISERARNEGIMGDAHLQRCLRELFSDAVAQWPASIEKNAMSEAIGHAVLDTAVRVEMGTTGKRMRYDDDGTMVLTGDISDSRASARAISNGDAVAMANSALLYLNDGFDAEKTVQALFRLNGKQVVVDGVEKTVRVQAMLSKKSHMQIYAMIPAGTDDFVNQEIQKAFKTGVAGCVVRHGPDFIVIDFATATPATWATDGVPADLIAVNKDVNQLKNAFRSSRTPCHIVDVSNITKQIEATRDLADKQAFIDILGAGILSLFGAQSYSARYVNDAVYGFSDDQLTEDTKTAYLSKMHADLQDSARYMTLEVVFERAWAQRLLYTQWIVDHEYAFPVPLHHRQMIGRALALVGDKRAQVTGNAVLDSTPVDEASINAKYHAVTQNSSPQAVSELITMIQLFDLQFTDIGSRIAQPQDVRMLSAILSAA